MNTAVHQSRTDHQYEDRQSARAHCPAPAARPHRRGDRIKIARRNFITLLGGTAIFAPLAAHAQDGGTKIIRIGFFGASLNLQSMAVQYGSFLAELREQGFIEGKNIAIDYKRNDDPHGLSASAAELMRSQTDLIVATGREVSLQAVISASRSIPIVFVAIQYDPIARLREKPDSLAMRRPHKKVPCSNS